MKPKKRSPDEQIKGLGQLTLGDFWAWAYSDLLSNRNRAILAEFIVGAALGVIDSPRVEWDAVDLSYQGKTIEVKSAAFLQSWQQERPSRIVFDISRKKLWYADTNTWSDIPVRAADCYVFCLYPEVDSSKTDILDIFSWRFFVASRGMIDSKFNNQKTLSLNVLKKITESVVIDKLKEAIQICLFSDETTK
ncbi:MAG: hypothetical protein ACUVXF_09240 [Desulfobaccales bacterium]